ncbi:MAG: hypothetical protein ACOYNZ_10430 [Rhodoferax sp.]
MKLNGSTRSLVRAGAAALVLLGAGVAAQAQDVFWSVGLYSPGVQLGVASAPPMMVVQPAYQPLYRQARPVHAAPQPMVYLRPLPVFAPPPQYIRADWRYPGHRPGWQYRQERHENRHSGHGPHDHRH